jgi:hypothetical protein
VIYSFYKDNKGGAMNSLELRNNAEILKNMIHTIRGKQVMLDKDIAEIYDIETRVLKQAVRRNIERFPRDFMIELSISEQEYLVSQSVIPSLKVFGGAIPFAFTEQGVAMLSAIIRTPIAIEMSIAIIRAFSEMKRSMHAIAGLFQRLDKVEQKQIIADDNFETLFKALETGNLKAKQGIFYQGQIFDAYCFLLDLIKTAKKSIIVIDNYIDESVLTMLSKRNTEVVAIIYLKNISKQLALDLQKHNEQYEEITLKRFSSSHDRFLILDKKEVYHFGASLKDLGKKWFAFSKLDIPVEDILQRLK